MHPCRFPRYPLRSLIFSKGTRMSKLCQLCPGLFWVFFVCFFVFYPCRWKPETSFTNMVSLSYPKALRGNADALSAQPLHVTCFRLVCSETWDQPVEMERKSGILKFSGDLGLCACRRECVQRMKTLRVPSIFCCRFSCAIH